MSPAARGSKCPTIRVEVFFCAALRPINATFFRALPMIVTRGRWSPGVFTAVVLFYPLGIAIFSKLLATPAFTALHAVLAFIFGALLMAYPIAMLHLKG